MKQEIINAVNQWSNSFIQLLVPPNLLSNSNITKTEDDGAKLVYAKFLSGEQQGNPYDRPFDGGLGNIITDLNEESLWLYSFGNETEPIPKGFTPKTYDSGYIRTGKVHKCSNCRGFGKVTCKTCGGKVRWSERQGDNLVEKTCSCGDGKQICGTCDGYSEMETVIGTKKIFKVFETKNSQYKGEVPEDKIKSITGKNIYEMTIDYPIAEIKEMLKGGINVAEFNTLNRQVLDDLHEDIDNRLSNENVNTKQIHEQLNILFQSVPNPGNENKLLVKEVMPIRVMVRVEDAPVTQIDYEHKDKNYSLWVYGNENKVYSKATPSSFNYKVIIVLTGILTILGFILFNS